MAVAAGKDSGDRARQNWISTLPLPLMSLENLINSLDLSELRIPPPCKWDNNAHQLESF